MTKDINDSNDSSRDPHPHRARASYRPMGFYDELKKLTPTRTTLVSNTPQVSNNQSVKRSDQKAKSCACSCAQVESFVGQQAVGQNSCGLKPEETRRYRVTARFTGSEHKNLVRRAQNARLTLSEYLRVVALKAPALDPERHRLLLKTNYELTRQGVNLNQLTKHFNAGQYSAQRAEGLLAEMFDALMAAQKAVHAALSEGRTYE